MLLGASKIDILNQEYFLANLFWIVPICSILGLITIGIVVAIMFIKRRKSNSLPNLEPNLEHICLIVIKLLDSTTRLAKRSLKFQNVEQSFNLSSDQQTEEL